MRKLLILLLAILAFNACEFDKDIEDDLKGNATINGQLSYHDLYHGTGEIKPLAGKKVFISYLPGDSLNYLYYTVTDAQGNFAFKRLKDGLDYLLFFSDTVDTVHFSKYISARAGKDTVKMLAENDTRTQNGMVFYILDEQSQPLKDVKVALFNNKAIFESDSTLDKSIDQKTSDQYGRVLFYNLKAATYYLRGLAESAAGKISADSSFNFSGTGISIDTLVMKTSLAIKNTLLVKTVDEAGNALPAIPFCLFNNSLLFNQESCNGSYQTGTTLADATVKVNNLPARDYYLYAETQFNNNSYKGKVMATVAATGQVTATLVMKKAAPNELLVRVWDESNRPLPGITVCMFNNPLLFNIASCESNYKSDVSKPDGTLKFTGLDPAAYYLYASFTQGATSYEAKNIVTVGANGQTTVDVVLKKLLPANEWEYTVKDNGGTVVNSADLYFFTSKVLFDRDTTLGNVQVAHTGPNGRVTLRDMEEGKYYIRARLVLGDEILLKGADSVNIVNSPVKQSKTVYVH